MFKYILILILFIGCTPLNNNEEVVKQYKICKDAGMCVKQFDSGYIRCTPCN